MSSSNKKIFDRLVSRTKIYLVIILILLILLCIGDIRFIIPSVITYTLIIAYTIWSDRKRKSELSNHIKDLTLSSDKAAKTTLINSPFPLIIAETNGNVIWRSSTFVNEFINVDINTKLSDLLREIKLEIENNDEDSKHLINKKIEIGNKTYKVYGKYTNSKNEYMVTLYFIDNTELVRLRKKCEDSNIYIGILMIDNYEEIIQRIDNQDKPQIIAEIEKRIYKWVSNFNGLAIKSDRDTFVCILEKKYVKLMKDCKFNILDKIKELDNNNAFQFTLSIAFSNEGYSNYEKYKSAQATLDIALGRGGDQAVLREDEKYTFFGGRTQELEKRTKVKARIVSHALRELILESKDVMIMGHTNGDIDSIGSSMGIYRLAADLGKPAYIVNTSYGLSLANFIETLGEDENYKNVIINKNESIAKISPETLLVIVDTDKRTYVDVPELLKETSKIVIIDHHRRSTDFIDDAMLTFHEVYASSAAELVTEIIEYSEVDVKLTELEAEALYAGIMMDTKNFTFKTGVRTFEAAAYLRKCGVDIITVKKWFQSDLETYNKISKIVAKAEITNDTIAIAICEEQDKNVNIICAKAADELLTISNVTASFVIGNSGDKIYISGRSIGDINVQLILEKLGGGGHITLAGAQVEGMTIEEVKQELINRINEYFSEILS